MKTVVVTGSTRGIGYGLAENFLKRGCKVVISGRNEAKVTEVVNQLGQTYGADKVTGKAGNVDVYDDIQAIWDHASTTFGQVDVWINNAGMSLERRELWKIPAEQLATIINTNITGLMYANKIVINGMLAQGHGQIWNMEGFGSDGMTQVGITPYGTSKAAVSYLTKSLVKELQDTPVQMCYLSPGIVVTDLLTGDYDLTSEEWKKTKKVLNILADTVDTVTPHLVDGVLSSNKSGAKVQWLSGGKVLMRFLLAGFRKRDLFAEVEAKAGVTH